MVAASPTTQTITLDGLAGAAELFDQVCRQGMRVLLQQNGESVAAIVPVADFERLKRLDEQYERDLTILRASQAAFADADPDELQREIDKAVAEVRDERRAQPRE